MPAPDAPEPLRLFRDEALQARRMPELGQILLAPQPPFPALVAGAALLGLAIVAFLTFGSYTRRSTVIGLLAPATGVIRVHTPQPGVVLQKRVVEGQSVRKGDVLYVLTSDRPAPDTPGLQAAIGAQVEARRRSLQAEAARNGTSEATEVAYLQRRAATLRAELEAIRHQLAFQEVRLKLAIDARDRYRGLADSDQIARDQYYQKESELADQQTRVESLRRDALAAQREVEATGQEIGNTHLKYANENANLQRSEASAQQELTEVEGRRQVVITAPEDGVATLVAADAGQAVDATRPLLNLLPQGVPLQARLYATSATVGFVRPGDRVQLRYQAFPYQKFGQYQGQVASISGVPVTSGELAGLPVPANSTGEPVYAITVTLHEQKVSAYGRDWPLQPGMRLEADVLHETRRLYEWALEPLYSVTGKL
jgi:membrane fusion protein